MTLLSLGRYGVSGCREIRYLSRLTALVELELVSDYKSSLTDDRMLLYLSNLTLLTMLTLVDNDELTDEGVYHLRVLSQMRHLELLASIYLTGSSLEHIGGLAGLSKLIISS
jgi:F-box and leucine-rich repeat protein 14